MAETLWTAWWGGSNRRQGLELGGETKNREWVPGRGFMRGATGGRASSRVWTEKGWTTGGGGANRDRERGWRATSIAGNAFRNDLIGTLAAGAMRWY